MPKGISPYRTGAKDIVWSNSCPLKVSPDVQDLTEGNSNGSAHQAEQSLPVPFTQTVGMSRIGATTTPEMP